MKKIIVFGIGFVGERGVKKLLSENVFSQEECFYFQEGNSLSYEKKTQTFFVPESDLKASVWEQDPSICHTNSFTETPWNDFIEVMENITNSVDIVVTLSSLDGCYWGSLGGKVTLMVTDFLSMYGIKSHNLIITPWQFEEKETKLKAKAIILKIKELNGHVVEIPTSAVLSLTAEGSALLDAYDTLWEVYAIPAIKEVKVTLEATSISTIKYKK